MGIVKEKSIFQELKREFFEIKVTSKFLDNSIAAVIPAAPLPMMSTSVLINFFEN